MIIKRLTMNNFGVYAGVNTFNFTHTKPIVLIGGMNGRGKTTFLEAILLALYGDNSNAYKESRYKSYGRYLRSFVNNSSVTKESFVELEFIMNEGEQEQYLIRREWNARAKTTEEKITIMENGIPNDFLTSNWSMFIENILPSALSSFFFFDGEKIAELAVDDTNAQMKESIRSMLGISVLDVLKNDLERSLRRKSKKIKDDTNEESMEQLQRKCKELRAVITTKDVSIAAHRERIQKKKDKIAELHRKYQSKGGAALEQRKNLIQRRSDLQVAIDQNDEKLVELASAELPLVLVKNLIQEIKLQAVEEHNDFIMQQTLTQIEELLEEYVQLHPEQSTPNREFIGFVRQQAIGEQVETIYELSDQALFQVNSLVEELLDSSKARAKRCLEDRKLLKKQLDDVESHLSLDINEKELNATYASIKDNENSLLQLEVRLAKREQEIGELHAQLNDLQGRYNRAVEEYLANAEMQDDTNRMIKYTDLAIKIVQRYTVELQKQKTEVLGQTITQCYKKLANKKNLIQKIVMDASTLDICYLDDEGNKVSKDSLSAGEKQLMVIAILWALAICSKKKLPVIIDTPLSRLDSMHRTSLITTYFPNASDQTIILSTDSEIDRESYQLMADHIGDEFTLNYSEETKSTTIRKGYFQES